MISDEAGHQERMRPALEVRRAAHANPMSEWPRPRSERPGDLVEGQLARPAIRPSFRITRAETVFTIGSCFTRELEDRLAELGFDVPCQRYEVPEIERRAPRPNSVLNQYVPAVMLQELRRARGGGHVSDGCLVEVDDDAVVDMQLFAPTPVTWDRALARRREVEAIFRRAFDSHVAIITLGQAEAWWDAATEEYCNQLPTSAAISRHPNRFFFRPLELDDIVGTVSETCELLTSAGSVDRIVLTISPVPISRAWGADDALASYVHSKSVLRVAAEIVSRTISCVDYFPSYEIAVLSDRSVVFSPDRMHLRTAVAREIADRMVSAYVTGPAG